jgi:hypothetical protein
VVHYAAGKEPPRLAHLKPADLTDYAEVAVPTPTEASYMKIIAHNRYVRAAVAENARRATMREDKAHVPVQGGDGQMPGAAEGGALAARGFHPD